MISVFQYLWYPLFVYDHSNISIFLSSFIPIKWGIPHIDKTVTKCYICSVLFEAVVSLSVIFRNVPYFPFYSLSPPALWYPRHFSWVVITHLWHSTINNTISIFSVVLDSRSRDVTEQKAVEKTGAIVERISLIFEKKGRISSFRNQSYIGA